MTYRQRANLILGLSFVAFIAIFLWWYTHDVSVWEELLFFVIQSALIGSIADWFAVTALFEKPLGFPYHTELLYRHRDRIIDGIARLISEKLLQPDMWKDKLYQFPLSIKPSTGCAALRDGKNSVPASMKWHCGSSAYSAGRNPDGHRRSPAAVFEAPA